MSRDDDDARDRAIDAEFEPADRGYRRSRGIGGGAALTLAALSAAAGAAGGAVAPRVPEVQAALDRVIPASQRPTESAAASDAGSLAQRLAAIEAVVNAPLPVAAEGAGDGGTAARVFALQSGLRDLETQLQTLPSSQDVQALVAEVRGLQEQLPAVAAEAHEAVTAARASYAVVAASEAARSSGPFEQAQAALAALLPEDANVAALAPLARTGAPTHDELNKRLDTLDNQILRAARESQAGSGFWGRIQAYLAQWIIVRRSGAGDTPEGLVETAQSALDADRLKDAIDALNRLPAAPKRVAQPWINDAQRRLEIDTRIALIRQELSRS